MNTESGVSDGQASVAVSPQSLGTPTEEFRPSPDKLFAGFVISLFIIAGGCYGEFYIIRECSEVHWNMPLHAKTGAAWSNFGLMTLVMLGVVAAGCGIIYYLRTISSLRVRFCPNGFYCESATKTVTFPWDQITTIREQIFYERLPLAKGVAKYAMPTTKSQMFTVQRHDGESFMFDADKIAELKKLGEILRSGARAHNLKWEVVEHRG